MEAGETAELAEHMGSGEVLVCVVVEEMGNCLSVMVAHIAVEVVVVMAMCIDSGGVVDRYFGEVVVAGQVERRVVMSGSGRSLQDRRAQALVVPAG